MCTKNETAEFHDPDQYLRVSAHGFRDYALEERLATRIVEGLRVRQRAAEKAAEDERLARPPPPDPGLTSGSGECGLEFAVSGKQGESEEARGVPVGMLISGRRALERGLREAKSKCFKDWPRDEIWVRIKVSIRVVSLYANLLMGVTSGRRIRNMCRSAPCWSRCAP